MKRIFKNNIFFLITYISILLIALVTIFSFDKMYIHLYFNEFNSPNFDSFFKLITNLGDGYFLGFVVLVLMFFNFRKSLKLIVSWLISSLLFVVPLKHIIFPEVKRPTAYFEGLYNLNLVEGVNQHSFHSFPSGHTTTAFVLFFTLAIFIKNKYLKLLMLLIAIITAFSRVYLSQHFFEDITAGSFLGIISVFIGHYLIDLIKSDKIDRGILK